jgi:hypothetical protein
LLEISAPWAVLAGVAVALTVAAIAGTVISIWRLWRLRADYRVVEAAERFEMVDLTTVVKRYVPSELQSQKVAEEIAIVKEMIGSGRPRWKRAAIFSGTMMLCGAAAAAFSIHQDMKAAGTVQLAVKPTVNLDALKDIQGVWGWKADFLQSCSENPQTISVTPDRNKLSIQYAKPYQNGRKTTTKLDFDVVSATPDMLVLSKSDPAMPTRPSSDQVYFKFIDANAFTLSHSNDPMGSSGMIARCQSRSTQASAAN